MSWFSKIIGQSKPGDAPAAQAGKARVDRPPKIVIDRHDYEPEEFILGSFRIRPYDGDLIAKQQFDFRIVFETGGETIDIACRGIVVRLDEQAGLVARYHQPQPFYQRKLIEYLRAWKGV